LGWGGLGEFIEHKKYVLILFSIFVKNISDCKKKSARYYLKVKVKVKLSHYRPRQALRVPGG
jgi:hypothetical protein